MINYNVFLRKMTKLIFKFKYNFIRDLQIGQIMTLNFDSFKGTLLIPLPIFLEGPK